MAAFRQGWRIFGFEHQRVGDSEQPTAAQKKYREKMDHADPRLEGRPQPIRHHLRRPAADELTGEKRAMETVEK